MDAIKIYNETFWEEVKKWCDDADLVDGAYTIRWMNGEQYHPICRLLETDEEGILYIGSSKNLPNRMGDLKKALLASYNTIYKDHTTHSIGKIKDINNFRIKIDLNNIKITLHHPKEYENIETGVDLEIYLLEQYELKYGETPPLNEGRPKSH